ncbi:Asp-tRNAAsn/Glu-tRNAGln amidotransferase A subunit [Actinokineospora iranica]|uniref:Asp-tRNAAsn/Glu-tRNAGln amidotransferase A subunit n=1 Tax=Actinokineospora iranica TaxID=1271860 RepID=A0A1G6RXG2_9PSEU|nr:Asp-tRNAAsn/Glu-tRNAGln amidotransferase A subunit [Actinokineospora iranica]
MVDQATYLGLSARRIAELVNTRELAAVDVVRAALARLAEVDGWLRAFRDHWPDQALAEAVAVDRAITAGRRLPLAGVPLGVKAWEWPDSPQIRRLRAAGCVPIGATSVPRGTDWQTWGHTDRGPTSNPWRPDLSPGGSSAGSAAAVAAGIVPLATGTDGAGSIRVPAAWCGVVGLKPTGRGRVPGPLARSAADAAAYLGRTLHATWPPVDQSGPPGCALPVAAAWSADLGLCEADARIVAVARSAADRLTAGAGIVWGDLDVRLRDPGAAWRALRDPAADHTEAKAVRARNDAVLSAVFDAVDLVVTPTTPRPPHGHDGPGEHLSVALTWAVNLSGHPAVSVPAGLSDGVPVGLQLIAAPGREDLLLAVAAAATGSGVIAG